MSPKVAKARLSCFLQFLLLSHSLPFLSCKELHSFSALSISVVRNPHFLSFHFASIRFSPFAVQRQFLIFGSPAVASGLRAVKSSCKITFIKVHIFKSIYPCQPLCSTYIGRQRPHFTSFHCGLFCLPPFAPFACGSPLKLEFVPAATRFTLLQPSLRI